MMSDRNVGSIVIVDPSGHPIGIVTDTDLRRKVVAGDITPQRPISTIMSSPVMTVSSGITAANAILRMMKSNIRHLCVTEDGKPDSPIVGVVSEHDILLQHGNNPAVLVKEMLQTDDIQTLARIRSRAEELVRQYLRQGVSLRFVGEIVSEINDVLTGRLIALAEARIVEQGGMKPEIPYCWISFGSEGRMEQLLRTDQDNALVYGDPLPGTEDAVRDFFRKLAVAVTDGLATCGFAHCPGNNMASNPDWCQPVSVWMKHFADWIHRPAGPALLNAAIFFDFRPVYGEHSLASRLRDHISNEIKTDRTSIILLAKNAIRNPPPVSFLGRFNLEKKGEGKRLFDLKLRGIKTFTDAARVLALDMGFHDITNTVERLRKLGAIDPSFAPNVPEMVMAFEVLARFRVLHGKDGGEGGRFVDIGSLNKLEREMMREAFRSMDRLSTLVRVRYQLDALGLG